MSTIEATPVTADSLIAKVRQIGPILQENSSQGERERYARLGIVLDDQSDCTLAPSVADEYQNRGLGSLIMDHLLDLMLRIGRKRLVLMGGTRAHNERAIHFYRKFGFRKVGEFDTGVNNYDMIVEIPAI